MKNSAQIKKIVSGIGLGSIIITGAAFYLAHRVIHPQRKDDGETPKSFGLRCKNLQFKSKDGTLLKGWLTEAEDAKGLIVLSHGYSYGKQFMLPAAKDLYKNNYSALLFDYRAHGESGGKKTTIGVLEQDDLIAAIEVAKSHSNNIGVIGISMGAATAIIALAKTVGIKCLVADSSFARLKDVIHRKSSILTGPIVKFMKMEGVDVEKSEPIKYIDKINMPVLFIHGEGDALVPFNDSEELFKKAKNPKELWIVKNASHGMSYFADKKEYTKKVIDFLNKYFKTYSGPNK